MELLHSDTIGYLFSYLDFTSFIAISFTSHKWNIAARKWAQQNSNGSGTIGYRIIETKDESFQSKMIRMFTCAGKGLEQPRRNKVEGQPCARASWNIATYCDCWVQCAMCRRQLPLASTKKCFAGRYRRCPFVCPDRCPACRTIICVDTVANAMMIWTSRSWSVSKEKYRNESWIVCGLACLTKMRGFVISGPYSTECIVNRCALTTQSINKFKSLASQETLAKLVYMKLVTRDPSSPLIAILEHFGAVRVPDGIGNNPRLG